MAKKRTTRVVDAALLNWLIDEKPTSVKGMVAKLKRQGKKIGVQTIYQMLRGEPTEYEKIEIVAEFFGWTAQELVEGRKREKADPPQQAGLGVAEGDILPPLHDFLRQIGEKTIVLRQEAPYIRHGTDILNRDDRHLVEEYRISLAVGPSPGSAVRIEYQGKDAEDYPYETLSLLKYALTFSPSNRCHKPDFALRYDADERLGLIHPDPAKLTNRAAYRRTRSSILLTPDPDARTTHHVAALIYGGMYARTEVATHFSFTQNALYRRIVFSLDLSAYPAGAVAGRPRLHVVQRTPGVEFNCCDLDPAGYGEALRPNREDGQRLIWEFASFEQKMIGVFWSVDKSTIPTGMTTTREMLESLLAESCN